LRIFRKNLFTSSFENSRDFNVSEIPQCIPIIKRAYFHFAKAETIEEIPQVQDHQALEDLQTDLKDQGLHNLAKE